MFQTPQTHEQQQHRELPARRGPLTAIAPPDLGR